MYTVLVCDDDIAIQNSIKIYLENDGYNVLTASDGEECIKKVENNEVHCLILDIMMPKIDGLNAMMKIRESKNIPIILLSAKSEDTDKITGLSFGADDYVTKPFNPLELLARVKSQIRRYSTLGSMQKTDSQLVTGGAFKTPCATQSLSGQPACVTRTPSSDTRIVFPPAGAAPTMEGSMIS